MFKLGGIMQYLINGVRGIRFAWILCVGSIVTFFFEEAGWPTVALLMAHPFVRLIIAAYENAPRPELGGQSLLEAAAARAAIDPSGGEPTEDSPDHVKSRRLRARRAPEDSHGETDEEFIVRSRLFH